MSTLIKGISWNCPISINNDFTLKVLSELVDNKINKDCAKYILLKYFDYMNSENATNIENMDEFIIATKREYEEIMVIEVQRAVYLVELLNETDKERRDKIANLLAELQ